MRWSSTRYPVHKFECTYYENLVLYLHSQTILKHNVMKNTQQKRTTLAKLLCITYKTLPSNANACSEFFEQNKIVSLFERQIIFLLAQKINPTI